MTDYEAICDFQNLYKAHLRARTNKRKKPEVIRFEMHLAENLSRMSRELTERTYRMGGYYHFTITEPKEREVFAAYYPDRVLLHCLCDEVIAPTLGPRLIYDNAACQKGKGPHFAQDRLAGFLREHYRACGTEGWVLKCDISKYFASIDHEVLKAKLRRVLRDRDVLELVFQFIDSYETEGHPGKGLPLGNQSSQWYAIYYLDTVDRLVKERLRIKRYSRYMDDSVIIHPDKDFLADSFAQMREVIEGELRLTLNPKSAITPLRDGVDYLGWRFFLNQNGRVIRRLKPAGKRRMWERLHRLQWEYSHGLADWEDARSVLASYHGHLLHGDTWGLRSAVSRDVVLTRGLEEISSPVFQKTN